MKKKSLKLLHSLRKGVGPVRTIGLDDAVLVGFLKHDRDLAKAIKMAAKERERLRSDHRHLFKMDEVELCRLVQADYLNFYPKYGINMYVPLAAYGSWIVTSHGAVLHDSGGYGMLGVGHAPKKVLKAMKAPYVMANVMTPSFSQQHLAERLKKEIGRSRGGCPFKKFVCLNSGSESVTFTCRVSDIHARRLTDPDGRHAGKKIMRLAAVDSFHGRTEGPARLSQACRGMYSKHLASFRDPDSMIFVPVNDLAALRETFEKIEKENQFVETFYLEPVMGEGVAGLALTREYYDLARTLTKNMGSLLVVDSIQAALRAQGCLSIVDYPGFETCEPPDMETYSKALNAGQYPLSVAALSGEVADEYVTGLYGNTMTTNPRALETACAVLDSVNEKLRRNIRERGCEFLTKFEELGKEFPGAFERVVGTGLMVSILLDPKKYRVNGEGGFEEYLRTNGIEMIHAGDNGLRFTPSFYITSAEIDLITAAIRQGLKDLAPEEACCCSCSCSDEDE